MKKLLSIIIPTYNMELYLEKCLNSITGNDIPNSLEIIIINDGSKDSSLTIAKEFQLRYPQIIIVIDKCNGNYGSCVNAALTKANGKYIKILDADDWFNTDSLKKFLILLEKENRDLILTNYNQTYTNGKIKHIKLPLENDKSYNDEILKSKVFYNMQMHAVTYKTSILKQLNYIQTENISYTDQEWIFYPMVNIKTITFFNLNLYQYLLGREGQTMSPQIITKNISHNIIIAMKMILYLKKISNTNTPQYFYLHQQLIKIIRNIFKLSLLPIHKSDLKLKEILEFDSFIRETNLVLYKEIEQITIHSFFPFKLVKYFHKHNSCPPYIIRFINNKLKNMQTLLS